MKKILHVTDRYAGGVSRAIRSRVKASPQYEHYLLWEGSETPSVADGFAGIKKLPRTHLMRVKAVRSAVSLLGAAIVHSHSSWAGFYSRISKASAPVVYEPHCFKFDDPALSKNVQFIFRQAEKLMAKRTEAFAVLSDHEEQLTKKLDRNARTVLLPNVASISGNFKNQSECLPSKIVMVGRICDQKDPDFFIQIVEALHKSRPDMSAYWIGDGDTSHKAKLIEAGVTVTGWLGPEELIRELRGAIYVHSASYEGFPLSILDAATVGCPIIARSIPAFSGTPITQANNPEEMAALIQNVLSSTSAQNIALKSNKLLLDTYNEKKLTQQLNRLYGMAERS